jgi:hypothetical protein
MHDGLEDVTCAAEQAASDVSRAVQAAFESMHEVLLSVQDYEEESLQPRTDVVVQEDRIAPGSPSKAEPGASSAGASPAGASPAAAVSEAAEPILSEQPKRTQKKAAQPDMLSLSISISILAKFMLFDLVGFLQVNSSIAEAFADLNWPAQFSEVSRVASSVFNLDFLTDIGESNCTLQSNHCYRVMVMMLTLLAFQLAFPAGVGVARFTPLRRCIKEDRIKTLIDRSFHGNAVVMMVLHPPISKQLSGLVECSWYNDRHVLSAHKSLACGLPVCWITALVFMVLYTLGIPLYVFLSLRSYLSPSARKQREGSEVLERYKARLGFICGKYEPDFWYYELLEMTRKTLLMCATSFLPKGSYMQLFGKLLVSIFFFVYLVKSTPFNSERLDLLVCTSQFCTVATLFSAIVMKIGFFEAEGVPEEAVNWLLMTIMVLPLATAVYIILLAIYQGFESRVDSCKRSSWARIRYLGAYLASPD